MEFNALIRAHLDRKASVKTANASIRSTRKNDPFIFAVNFCEINEESDGSFQIKANITETAANHIANSQEQLRKENRKRIDRNDALDFEGETDNGIKVSAKILGACFSIIRNNEGVKHELSADLYEIEFSQDQCAERSQHNTYLIYPIKSRPLPCETRVDLPPKCSKILMPNWAGNNTHVTRSEHDVAAFRDNTNQIIATKTASLDEAQKLRHDIDACFSFLLGQMHESVGLIHIDGSREVFIPLPASSHAIIYAQPIRCPGPHYEPMCIAFWDAFSKIRRTLESLGPEDAKDLRRAINKPLHLPAGGLFELRVMLLAIAVEALANSVIPEDLETYVPPEGIQQVIDFISRLPVHKKTINRATGSLNQLLKPGATNALKSFTSRMKLGESFTDRWRVVRGKLTHGKGLDYENIDEVMRDYDQILMLHNSIILSSAGYTGPIANHIGAGDNGNLLLSDQGINAVTTDPLKDLETLHYEKTLTGRFSPKNTGG